MTRAPLMDSELELMLSVLRQHQEIESATLFGSRAKGTHSDRSDVDLALAGSLGALGAEAIAAFRDSGPGGSTARLLAERQAEREREG